MCNCSSNFSSFDGFDYDMDEFDGFIRSKAGKKRRKRKKELRSQGLSRKEARKQALAEIPRTKKKREAVKLAKQEARAEAEAISVMEAVQESASPEIAELMEEGILSSDPSVASLEIAESIGEEKVLSGVAKSLSMGMPRGVAMSRPAPPPIGVMTPPEVVEMGMAKMSEDDDKIFGLPKTTAYIVGAVVIGGGLFMMMKK